MLNLRDEVIEEYEEGGSSSREVAVPAAHPTHLLALDPRTLVPPPPASHPIGAVNVHNSKGVTVGTKILNITVDNREKVKGHLLGLEFVSQVKQPRSVRCSFAVCACWVVVVAAGFFIFILNAIIRVQPTLIDVDLSFCSYLSNLVRNTSRVERYACAVVTSLVLLCAALGLFFILKGSSPPPDPDQGVAWYIDRAEWLAEESHLEEADKMMEPAPLVVINHSAGVPCYNFKDCAAEMRTIQSWYIHGKNWTDGPYNFALGTDGRVYEGRGWGYAAAHTKGYNLCAIGIGFLGDYRSEGRQTKPTAEQVSNMHRLLQQGVERGHLRQEYVIMGHCDLRDSDSPGNLLHEAMQRWQHYNSTTYSNMSCEQIFQLIGR